MLKSEIYSLHLGLFDLVTTMTGYPHQNNNIFSQLGQRTSMGRLSTTMVSKISKSFGGNIEEYKIKPICFS